MNAAVLDTSVILKWYHQTDEDDVGAALLLRDAWLGGALEVTVPDLLVYELINSLVRKKQGPEEINAAIESVWTMGLQIYPVDNALSRSVVRLAVGLGITAYDATFLALSLELSAPLITDDRALHRRVVDQHAVMLLAEISGS